MQTVFDQISSVLEGLARLQKAVQRVREGLQTNSVFSQSPENTAPSW